MKELVLKSREQIALLFIVLTGCFLLFYWTHLAFVSYGDGVKSDTVAVKEKISKVDALVKNLNRSTNRVQRVNTGLLAFMQRHASQSGLDNKLTVIKPKSSVAGKESAAMRFEKMTLSDLLSITDMIDKYDNLQIDSMSVTKRFDDKKLVNISMELSKTK